MSSMRKPGRKLDEAVALDVMDWQHGATDFPDTWYRPAGNGTWDAHLAPWPFSTEIGAAFEIVSKLGLPFELNCDDEQTLWNARFNLDRGEWAQASTAPHAISLAALKARK